MNDLKRISKYKNILYDFDQTIAKVVIDWLPWLDWAQNYFRKFEPGIIIPRGSAFHQLQNEFVKKYGREIRDEMSKFNEQYEYSHYTDVKPNKDLIEFIKNIKDKNQFIITNQNRLLLNKLLKELGLTEYITKSITRDDVYFIKPAPEAIQTVIGDDKNLSQYIYVGDAASDEAAAKDAGIDFELIQME